MFTAIVATAETGQPANAARPSAVTGQTIVLQGQGFTSSTLVQFQGVDDSGALGTLTRSGSVGAGGTTLSVIVPALARSGAVSVLGSGPATPVRAQRRAADRAHAHGRGRQRGRGQHACSSGQRAERQRPGASPSTDARRGQLQVRTVVDGSNNTADQQLLSVDGARRGRRRATSACPPPAAAPVRAAAPPRPTALLTPRGRRRRHAGQRPGAGPGGRPQPDHRQRHRRRAGRAGRGPVPRRPDGGDSAELQLTRPGQPGCASSMRPAPSSPHRATAGQRQRRALRSWRRPRQLLRGHQRLGQHQLRPERRRAAATTAGTRQLQPEPGTPGVPARRGWRASPPARPAALRPTARWPRPTSARRITLSGTGLLASDRVVFTTLDDNGNLGRSSPSRRQHRRGRRRPSRVVVPDSATTGARAAGARRQPRACCCRSCPRSATST